MIAATLIPQGMPSSFLFVFSQLSRGHRLKKLRNRGQQLIGKRLDCCIYAIGGKHEPNRPSGCLEVEASWNDGRCCQTFSCCPSSG